MTKGFLWFAQNNANTDYVELSIKLARSIKKNNKHNKICVVTDKQSQFNDESVDVVEVMKDDARGPNHFSVDKRTSIKLMRGTAPVNIFY